MCLGAEHVVVKVNRQVRLLSEQQIKIPAPRQSILLLECYYNALKCFGKHVRVHLVLKIVVSHVCNRRKATFDACKGLERLDDGNAHLQQP